MKCGACTRRGQARRRFASVDYCLRISVASAAVGVALISMPGVAVADDGGAASSDSAGAHARTTSTSGNNDKRVRPDARSARRVTPAGVRQSASATTRQERRPQATADPAPKVLAARGTARTHARSALVAKPSATVDVNSYVPTASASVTVLPKASAATPSPLASSIAGDFQQFLGNAAQWLSGLPANPIVDVLQGAVWLIRRTLFPSSVGVVTVPIQVPLQLVDVCLSGTDTAGNCKGPTLHRLGIYVSLGSNASPQFFEFDTGAAGFHAAYASEDPTASPWWGAGVTTGAPITKSFDSGLVYQGNEATTTVSFYESSIDTTPLLTTGNVLVGQMDKISDGDTTVWTPEGEVGGQPPIDNVFYGDFGAAPSYEANGISNLLNELTFACGVAPGYRIHVDPVTGQSWLQIGLTETDVLDPTGMYVPMVLDPAAPGSTTTPNSGTRYYAPQLFLATITIVDGSGATLISDASVGITPDTGADTTVHNTNRSSASSAIAYAGLTISTDDDKEGHLQSGLGFSLSGTTAAGTPVTFFAFDTTPDIGAGRVGVQNGTSEKEVYYLNTGISLFLDYDVVYNMGGAAGGGTLGLIPNGVL